jgi:probable S-adenosylmethionine-dependent methyltransferase, YraL family
MPGKLYIVATPIGNLEDVSARARRTLAECDIIAAEDTRNTQKLLSLLGIEGCTVSNHKFNERGQAESLVAELLAGKNVAVVSDAGTPCINDPGYALVDAAAKTGIVVIGVCGPSAVITALSVSGFGFDSFAFYGFFPREKGEAARLAEKIKNSQIPVSVCFESPLRIKKTLQFIADEFADAELCLCNDLTKLYERIYRGSPGHVLAELEGNPSFDKGEYTLVIRYEQAAAKVAEREDDPSCEALLLDYAVKHGGTAKDAVSALLKEGRGKYTKNELYAASLNLKGLLGKLYPGKTGFGG